MNLKLERSSIAIILAVFIISAMLFLDPPHGIIAGIIVVLLISIIYSIVAERLREATREKGTMRFVISTSLVTFTFLGLFGMCNGIFTAAGFNPWTNVSTEMPLGLLDGIAVDDDGRIILGLQFYGRIQVYNREGRFMCGWFIDGLGSSFKMRIGPEEKLEVLTIGMRRLKTFTVAGALISEKELSDKEFYKLYDDFGESGKQPYKSPNGELYQISSDFPFPFLYLFRLFTKPSCIRPHVERIDANGQRAIVIVTPWHKWLWMGPEPAFSFFLIGLFVSFKNRSNNTHPAHLQLNPSLDQYFQNN